MRCGMQWSGQDPGEIFELVEKLGEGYCESALMHASFLIADDLCSAFGAVYKAIHKASGFLLVRSIEVSVLAFRS